MPLVLVAELAVFSFQIWTFYTEEQSSLVERLADLTSVQSAALATAVWEFDDEEINNLIRQLIRIPFMESLVIYDDTGALVASSGDYQSEPEHAAYRETADIVYFEGGDSQIVGRLTLTVNDRHIHAALIDHARLTGITLITLFAALVGGTLISTRLFIGRPLNLMMAAIEREKSERQHQQVDWESSDELGLVVKSYNAMQLHQESSDKKIAEYQDHLQELVRERTSEIQSSIEYASRIQRAMLPGDNVLSEVFSNYFIHWEPREPVGGDMVWCRRWGDGHVVILGDGTGHGVSGAFMTLICSSALERAAKEIMVGDLPQLVQRIHQLTQKSLGQDKESCQTDDGMELGACYIPNDMGSLNFVGARFDLFIVEGGKTRKIKGSKAGIGYPDIAFSQVYQSHDIPVRYDQSFYMTTDGILDQIGGAKRCMFGRRQFQAMLASIDNESFSDRKNTILETFQDHQGNESRRDDVAIIGFSLEPLITPS